MLDAGWVGPGGGRRLLRRGVSGFVGRRRYVVHERDGDALPVLSLAVAAARTGV